MRRREFIALIGGVTAWPTGAQARAGVPTMRSALSVECRTQDRRQLASET